ncbi:CHAT domain-containing protein [Mastigocladopsis repens]|uniref:CHAT domain-containing protein n=1 Tax=Mastigocladopsis repens TaxID=221287 RepID=UPI0002EC110C|nr:CHAT domain-containing protein [Mastigocladopsis repens]
MITEDQRRRLERERNSFKQLYQLQSEKVERIQKALIIETDPSRKFQYEQQIQEEERTLKELDDKLYKIENQLQSAPLSTKFDSKKIQQKILILAAIPQPHDLRLDKEMREIRTAIERATRRDLFEIDVRTAVRSQDIRRAIAEVHPQIVHFCGHGMEDGSLVLEDDGGKHKPVSPEGLAALFKLHAEYVNCVLLNACYSEKAAKAISQYINYTIGMNQPIKDQAAIIFAQGFYDGLGYKNLDNQDIFQRAFDEGIVAIQMENLAQGQIPVFKKKLAKK